MNRPSAILPVVAVILIALGLILFYIFGGSSNTPAKSTGPAPAAANNPTTKPLQTKPSVSAPPAAPSPIFAALTSTDPAALTRALAANKNGVDAKDASGRTPLMVAAQAGNAEAVRTLAAANASIDAKDSSGNTALILAARAGKLDSIRALLDQGASINAANDAGQTALAAAAGEPGHADTVRLLLEASADPEIADASHATPLMLAAEHGDADCVIVLLNAGASPTAKTPDGRSALDRAKTRTDDAGKAVVAVLDQAD